MKVLTLFLASTICASAQSIGDVIYLKSGSPALTVTLVKNPDIGVQWFNGGTMMAATLPIAAIAIDDPAPKIAKAASIIAKRDNPPDAVVP